MLSPESRVFGLTRLRRPALSEAENRRPLWRNANPTATGTITLEVTIAGDPDPVTGMVLDLRELKEIMNAEVVDPWTIAF
jgi:6-pyruvoyltetrahydropterin/6-carboxytetrahydropterin synthase